MNPFCKPAALAAIASCLALGSAHAAGNHHAVDDAAILDAGQCELEGWVSRPRGSGTAFHSGVGCRLGPVELGAAADYARAPGGSETGWALQLKWAHEFAPGLAAGFAVSPGWRAHARPRHQGTAVVGLFTWRASDALALHANLGRDFARGGPDEDRGGVALEWAAHPQVTLMAERYLEGGGHYARAGVRWMPRSELSIDLSRSHRLSGTGASAWTLGATWLFD